MLEEALKVLIITIAPGFEARVAVAYVMIALNIKSPIIPLAISIPTILIGIALYWILDKVEEKIKEGKAFPFRSRLIRAFYFKYVNYIRNKSRKYVEKYGVPGLILFITIPLPGSGAWTGALVAKLFNISYDKAAFSIILGVIFSSYISYTAINMGLHVVELVI